jgi:hypothetical protein
MTDYYPLIARAVAGLAKSTGENRRALYERARSALLAQLRNLDPPLAESEITRERLLLEEAVRKVEADAARQQRAESPRASPTVKDRPVGPAAREAEPGATEPDDSAAEPQTVLDPGAAKPAPAPGEKRDDPRASAGSAQWAGQFRTKDRERSEHAAAQALKGFRDLVAEVRGEAAPLPENPAGEPIAEPENRAPRFPKPTHEPFEHPEPAPESPKPRRQSWGGSPAGDPEIDWFEPRIESRGSEPRGSRPSRREGLPAPDEPHPRMELPPSPQRSMHARQLPEPRFEREGGGSARALIAAFFGVFIVVGIALALYWQRDRLRSVLVRTPATQAQREAAPSRPKISDRVGQGGQQGPSTNAPGSKEGEPAATVAQRVVLYEDDPADAQGKPYVGSVIWRTETVPSGAGQAPELAVKAELEISDRRFNMTMLLRRNADKALPASHTIEIMFNLPADIPFGGISNVPGILMKQSEQTRGSPLAGLAVKVTSGFFLIGLSAAEGDMQRNLQLLKERSWFDIPLVYNNGRRAILAVEKGTPGERAFKEAFAAWGE